LIVQPGERHWHRKFLETLFMLKSAVLGRAIVVAGTAALFLLAVGCDDAQQRAERAARTGMAKAQVDQAAAGSPDALRSVESEYDSLASQASLLPPDLQILIHAHQGAVRFDRAMMFLGDLQSKQLLIIRTINNLEKLAMQVQGAEQSIAALQAYDPSTQIASIQAKEAAIRGSDPGDVDSTDISGATLAQLSARIDHLNSQIDQNQSQTKALQKTRDDASNQADALTRQSEAETGDQQAQDSQKASDLRRQAGDAGAQLDTLVAQLSQLHSQLDAAQAQQSALQSSIAALDTQIQAIQSGWTTIQQQIQAQQQVVQQLIGSDSATDTSGSGSFTIAQLAAQLSTLQNDAATQRDTVNSELDKAIASLGQAASQAEQLRQTMLRQSNMSPTAADVGVWKQSMETLHPMYYNQQKAAALVARAGVAADQAVIEYSIARLFDGYQITASTQPSAQPVQIPGLTALLDRSKTGVDMPQALASLHRSDADTIKQMKDDVDARFTAALTAYSSRNAIDSGDAGMQRINAARMGRVLANRQWANYALLIGDSDAAQSHLHDADADESQIPPEFRGVNAPAFTPPPPPTDNGGSNADSSSSSGN
jgi:hypothetical protein